ncbi:anthranilate synthase component II [Pseudobacteroides cellulosolvens]|uniref:Glutamine amidotransferase of anthranilate synthase n=1 Tax=Pseudobacteroides cellulosolvens ATCC 35603 = DSM 2933 TaxID=398512 RepID=A0A0L6JHV1_9FIRM|nr:aminodeoxychorismate/anthranilate synthase component II [Pseudobacteroides cellulosolvens]KNY25280.1 glutamine amidotransferase of anthranilate synthase [Pseudobacteroides cellulosolvens ATCC 35603 = DSM 2933]
MIIIIDNYDSFTYNLYQFIGEINPDIEVYRNDKITIEDVMEKKPSHIIISPGPGFPKDAGICTELIKRLGKSIPLLGVCLGHQSIGEAFGGRVIHAKELMHGKASEIDVDSESPLFKNLPGKIMAGRYHSLIVERSSLPQELKITANTEDGEIMGFMHKEYPIYGIQFHPESILTPDGKEIIRNFLSI